MDEDVFFPIRVAVIQCPLGGSREENINRVMKHVMAASCEGAVVILPPELFETPYFCRGMNPKWFAEARPFLGNEMIRRFAELATELKAVIPVSFFEQDGDRFFNSIAMIDASGEILGVYRKSHIPDGPGYDEKFYFAPGDTGFRVWSTSCGRIGVGICWDQWFPECARAMALLGADLLLYPTAIGSEPVNPGLDTRDRWQRVMQGHAVANVIPVAAANRTGTEGGQTFYGSSFICDDAGDILNACNRTEEGFATADVNLAEVRRHRADWKLLTDRRPELYGALVNRS